MRAVVRAALVAVRGAPSVRAEQVSQESLGSVLRVLDSEDDWLRVSGEDGYEGWVHQGGVIPSEGDEAEAWWDRYGRPALVLEATLGDESDRPVLRLPWGARVAVADGEVCLPDGRRCRLLLGDLVDWAEVGERFSQAGAAVVETAWRWRGVPYLWGGRTCWGVDCSGFVQAVYRVHGFVLPRDSHEQFAVGNVVAFDEGYASIEAGDLLFFRARDSERVVHVGLASGGSTMLHAAQPNGEVRCDDLAGDSSLERSLAARLVGVRRLYV